MVWASGDAALECGQVWGPDSGPCWPPGHDFGPVRAVRQVQSRTFQFLAGHDKVS